MLKFNEGPGPQGETRRSPKTRRSPSGVQAPKPRGHKNNPSIFLIRNTSSMRDQENSSAGQAGTSKGEQEQPHNNGTKHSNHPQSRKSQDNCISYPQYCPPSISPDLNPRDTFPHSHVPFNLVTPITTLCNQCFIAINASMTGFLNRNKCWTSEPRHLCTSWKGMREMFGQQCCKRVRSSNPTSQHHCTSTRLITINVSLSWRPESPMRMCVWLYSI